MQSRSICFAFFVKLVFAAIALSAYASQSGRQESLKTGFVDHIVKPIDLKKSIEIMVQLAR